MNEEKGGFGNYGAALIAYRSIFHIIGSLLFIVFATLVSQRLFGNETALYILLAMAAFALVYQEFFLQPRTFGQMRLHSVIDLLSWIVPFGIFLYQHISKKKATPKASLSLLIPLHRVSHTFKMIHEPCAILRIL
jgi:uncharacterized membrane protein